MACWLCQADDCRVDGEFSASLDEDPDLAGFEDAHGERVES